MEELVGIHYQSSHIVDLQSAVFHTHLYLDRLSYQVVQTGGRSVLQLRTLAMPLIDDATTIHTKASPYTVLDLSIYIIARITPVHICTSVLEHTAYQPE